MSRVGIDNIARGLALAASLATQGQAITPDQFYKRSDADYTAAFLRAWEKRPGTPIYMPTDYQTKLTGVDEATDQDIILFGPGRFIQSPGYSALTVKRPISAAVSVSPVLTSSLVSLTTNNTDDKGDTLWKVIPASMAGITAGQKWLLTSLDELPYGNEVNAGSKVINNQIIQVRGLALDYSGGSAFTEDTEVQGAISGAKMVVRSAFGVATGIIIGTSITPGPGNAMFVNGETLNVAGSPKATLAAVPYVVTKQKIYYDFTASPEMRLMSDSRFVWDGPGIAAIGDQNAVITAANRKTAIDLYGIVNPQMRYFADSAYARAMMLTSGWMGNVRGHINSLPNDANLPESAYGYGCDFAGATFGTNVKMTGGNCRHMQTTNLWYMNGASSDDLNRLKRGTVIGLHFTGRGINTHSATWDNHEASLDCVWDGCVAILPSNAKRNITQSVGFQDRSFGSTFKNGKIYGPTVGILIGHRAFTNGLPGYVSRYENNEIDAFGEFGIQDNSNVSAIGNAKLVIRNNRIAGDASSWAGNQAGVFINKLAEADIEGNEFSGVRDSQIYVRGAGIYRIGGGKMDFRDVPAGVTSYPVRYDGDPTIIMTRPIEIINGTATPASQPPALVRNAGTANSIITMLADPLVSGRTSKLPLVINTSTGVATVVDGLGRSVSITGSVIDADYAARGFGAGFSRIIPVNKCPSPRAFGTGVWSLSGGATVVDNSVIGFDGRKRAALATLTATSDAVRTPAITIAAADFQLVSCFVKAGTASKVRLYCGDSAQTNFFRATFDMTAGALASTPSVAGAGVLTSYGTVDYGNGWYYIWAYGQVGITGGIRAGIYPTATAGDLGTINMDAFSFQPNPIDKPGSYTDFLPLHDVTVGVSAQTIGYAQRPGELWTVSGISSAIQFTDVIMTTPGLAPEVVKTGTGTGSPSARTYTMSGNGTIQLSMASGSYAVTARPANLS
tara:strand:+ start:91 stop:2964 length:2874 start_codon:yes stop_codon:yes gene_type:complete